MMTDCINRWVPIGVEQARTSALGVALSVGLIVGTGGMLAPDQVSSRLGTGSVRYGTEPSIRPTRRGLAPELATIRSTLRLSVAELAELFGVTRPTIYSWQNGNDSTEEHAARVRAVASAIESHGALFAAQQGRIARRAIKGRTTLLDLLRAGDDPAPAIATLATMLQQEAAQRDRMARRLEGKRSTRGTPDTDALG